VAPAGATPAGLSEKKRLIARQWLERVLQTYPENASRSLRLDKDPFRNPVGNALTEGLHALVEEIFGGMDPARITPALDGIVRIRAVQDFTAGQAVSFVFLLREVMEEQLRGEAEMLGTVGKRIDELAIVAFDLFMQCREKIYEIKAGELKRSMYLQLRRDRGGAVQ
jgi:hypothetical protein